MLLSPPLGCRSRTRTMRSASGYGKGRRRRPRTKLNIAVLAPMASAQVATATAEKAGLLRSRRTPWRKSCRSLKFGVYAVRSCQICIVALFDVKYSCRHVDPLAGDVDECTGAGDVGAHMGRARSPDRSAAPAGRDYADGGDRDRRHATATGAPSAGGARRK